MLIVTFLLFVWTTSCWFTQGMERPFLGLPFLSMDVVFPFIVLVLWSVVSSGVWLFRKGRGAFDKASAWYRENRRAAIGIALIVLLYLLLQIPAVVMYRAVNDSDSAHYGVAGYHIADGKDRPMWFYGKHYNGTFSPHAAALLHLIFGKQPAHLRIVDSLQYLGFLLFLFATVRRLSDDRTALLAAALAAVPPYLINQFISNTYFASVMFFGSWGFYLLVRLLDKERPVWRDYFWIGAVYGFGFFTHLQLIYFILTALILFFARDKRFLLRPGFWAFVPGFLLGSIVTVIDSYYYDFIIFRRFFSQAAEPRGMLSGFTDGAGEFFRHVPDLLGANRSLGLPDNLVALLMPLVMLLVGAAILAVMILNWRKLLGMITFRDEHAGLLGFVLYFAVIFLLFSASSESTPPSPARYVAPVWFALVPIIAVALIALPRKYYFRAGIIGLTFTLFAASNISFDLRHADREGRLAAWEQFMYDRGIRRYFGDFWVTYLGNFITREEIIGSCVPDLFEAYKPYYYAVANDPGPTVYHFRGEDRHFRRTRQWLDNVGLSYDRVDAPYGIFFLNLSQRATVAQLYGLVKKPYSAAIEDIRSSAIIGGDGSPLPERLLTLKIRNSGEAEWQSRKAGVIVEAVVLDGQGNVIRRHHLGWRIGPGEIATVRTILTRDELKKPYLRVQVRVNDIYLTDEPLPPLAPGIRIQASEIQAEALDAAIFEQGQRDFLTESYAFFEGWLRWETESGNLIRYAVDGRSRIGLFFEKPESVRVALVLAPYRFQRELTPVHINLSLNGEPLDAGILLDRSKQAVIELPRHLIKPGFNILTMTYNLVEPAYDRLKTGSQILRHRRRAFSIDSMSVTAVNETMTEGTAR